MLGHVPAVSLCGLFYLTLKYPHGPLLLQLILSVVLTSLVSGALSRTSQEGRERRLPEKKNVGMWVYTTGHLIAKKTAARFLHDTKIPRSFFRNALTIKFIFLQKI